MTNETIAEHLTGHDPDVYFRTYEAAAFLKRSVSSLDKDRCSGQLGIPFIKVGRLILYNRAELQRWLQQRHQYKSTSEYQK